MACAPQRPVPAPRAAATWRSSAAMPQYARSAWRCRGDARRSSARRRPASSRSPAIRRATAKSRSSSTCKRDEADFWYLGCIDATLWWLIAVRLLDRAASPRRPLARTLAPEVERAIGWLACQEHQRFFLLQQNEASDWADIMPRSGFVLYTQRAVVSRQAALRLAACRAKRTATSTSSSIRSRRRSPSTGARGCSRTTSQTQARNRDLYLELRQLLVLRRRRRHVRQRARRAVRSRGRRGRAPHVARARCAPA